MSVAIGYGEGLNRWQADVPLEDIRSMVLELWPNGGVNLFAMTQKLPKRELDNFSFSWLTYTYPRRGGTITNLYTNAVMSSAYTSGGVSGDVLYVKVAEAVADHFVAGKEACLRYSLDPTCDVRAKVTGVSKNGADSRLTVQLLEDDDNSLYSYDLSDADIVFLMGSMNPQGGTMHTPIRYKKTKTTNATQIFMGPVKMTRTQTRIATRQYGKSPQKAMGEAKLDGLNLVAHEIEMAFHIGSYYEGTGDTGEPETAMRGLATSIQEFAPENTSVYNLDTDYTGLDWTVGGEDWINEYLNTIFSKSPVGPNPVGGGQRRPAYCGLSALSALKTLAKEGTTMEIQPKETVYGFQLHEWWSDYGVVELYVHPAYNLESSMMRTLMVFDWSMLTYCTLDDLQYYDDPGFIQNNWGHTGKVDGVLETWLAEISLEVHNPSLGCVLHGLGLDNDLS